MRASKYFKQRRPTFCRYYRPVFFRTWRPITASIIAFEKRQLEIKTRKQSWISLQIRYGRRMLAEESAFVNTDERRQGPYRWVWRARRQLRWPYPAHRLLATALDCCCDNYGRKLGRKDDSKTLQWTSPPAAQPRPVTHRRAK